MKTNTSLVNLKMNHCVAKSVARSITSEYQRFALTHTFGDELPDSTLVAYDDVHIAFSELRSSLKRLALINQTEYESTLDASRKSASGTRAPNRSLTGIG